MAVVMSSVVERFWSEITIVQPRFLAFVLFGVQIERYRVHLPWFSKLFANWLENAESALVCCAGRGHEAEYTAKSSSNRVKVECVRPPSV